jgi:hypothetical protein
VCDLVEHIHWESSFTPSTPLKASRKSLKHLRTTKIEQGLQNGRQKQLHERTGMGGLELSESNVVVE